jgi:hypothetical protein
VRVAVAVAVAAALSIAVTACTGGSGDDGALPGEPTESTTSTTVVVGPVLTDAQEATNVDATFQYGAFDITIGWVVYDPADGSLLLGARFHNLGEEWESTELAATVTSGGEESPVLGDPVDVPPGVAVDLTLEAGPFSSNPLDGGTLTWGRPDRDQPVVALAPRGGDDLFTSTILPLDAWGSIGKYTVRVTAAEVFAGDVSFNRQADPGNRVVRFHYDEYANTLDPVNGWYGAEHLLLRGPDGTDRTAVAASTGRAPLSWTTGPGQWIDFEVPEPVAGTYDLLLGSVSTNAFSLVDASLIERTAIRVELADPGSSSMPSDTPATAPRAESPVPVRRGDGTGAPFEVDLDAGTVNVAGFSYRPEHLSWDGSSTAELTGTVSLLETVSDANQESLVGGLLDAPIVFGPTVALVSGGELHGGFVSTTSPVTPGQPLEVTIEFSADRLHPDDLGLYLGPRTGAVSSIPLTEASTVPRYPPPPTGARITAPAVTAGDWTVQLVSYRVGMLRSDVAPPPGQLDLEVAFDVTASPDAVVRSLGLSFAPVRQLFRSGFDGYLQQAVADSGLVFYEPGQTQRQTATFRVPDSFQPGTYGFALRGYDEVADVTVDSSVEVTFGAQLGTTPAAVGSGL